MVLKGIHYRWPLAYQIIYYIRTIAEGSYRFDLATEFVKAHDSVFDFCAGRGDLEKFLSQNSYTAIEINPVFIRQLKQRGINVIPCDLHENLCGAFSGADVAIMVESLYQFADTSIHSLLEELKLVAKRIVIIERTVVQQEPGWLSGLRDYLCSSNFYRPARLLTVQEFKEMMTRHNYNFYQKSHNYCLGIFGEE